MKDRSGPPDIFPDADVQGWRAWLYLAPSSLLLLVLPIDHTTALRMLFLVLTAVATAWFWRCRDVARIPLLLPFATCFLVALASVPGADDPVYSLNEVKKELGYGLIVFLGFYSLARTRREVATWMMVILFNILWLGIYTLWQGLNAGTLAFDGWHGGVLNYSVFVATVFPLLLAALGYPGVPRNWKIAVLILIPLTLFTTYLTENRIFWIAIGASTLMLAGLYLNLRSARSATKVVMAGTIVILVACTLAFSTAAKQRIGSQTGVAETLSTIVETDPRNRIWAYSVQRIQERPWMGTGFGRMAQAKEFAEHFDHEPLWVHAHNMFLDYGIQMGVPGILAFAFLFACVIREFLRLYRSSDLNVALIGIAGIGIVAAVILKSATDDQFVRHNALLFWALVGMGLGYGARLGAKVPSAEPL
ncbi:MAG TPA: O-antigen ligase family protein [Burkholderiales bacterium]